MRISEFKSSNYCTTVLRAQSDCERSCPVEKKGWHGEKRRKFGEKAGGGQRAVARGNKATIIKLNAKYLERRQSAEEIGARFLPTCRCTSTRKRVKRTVLGGE